MKSSAPSNLANRRQSTPRSPAPGAAALVVGAGVAAGAALAAAALQRKLDTAAPAAAAETGTASAEGYRLTDHVRRYYETTRT